MLRSIKKIREYTLFATDGEIDQCQDFLFDDRGWAVRYLVAKVSKWTQGHQVLISPVFLDQPDWAGKHLPVRLSKEQIQNSPSLDEHAPVSRKYEINYHQYYTMPYYWIGQDLWGHHPDPKGVIYPVKNAPLPDVESRNTEEGHLRSTNEVTGYHIAAKGGNFGHVEDFLVDDNTWALQYLVIDTRNWIPGRRVLFSPKWLESISWVDQKVHVDLDIDKIKNSPQYDPSQPVSRSEEAQLYEYYQQPYYW